MKTDEKEKRKMKTEKKKTFLSGFDTSFFDIIYKNKDLFSERAHNIYNWKRCKIVPLDIYEILINKKPQFKKSSITSI